MFYVFHGPDELARTETLAGLKAQLGDATLADLNTTYLDGRTVTLPMIQEACGAMPFLAERRLVIVSGYLKRLRGDDEKSHGDKAALAALADYLPHLPPTARLVFVEEDELPGKHPILVLAEKRHAGHVRAFGVPTKEDDLADWIDQRVKHKGARIDGQAAMALAVAVGNDMRLLDSEIDKLVTYAGGDQPTITTEAIDLLVPYTGESNVFKMVDAIGQRNARVALHHLHGLLEEDPADKDRWLQLMGMIIRQFRILIQVKEMVEQGHSSAAIAKQVGIKDWIADKARRQAMNFSLAHLEAIYGRLLHTDLAIKSGKMDPVLALDTLVAGLCSAPDGRAAGSG
jgi:DNA polymerase III subunit delta